MHISKEILHILLDYNEITGNFTWKTGELAGFVSTNGYVKIKLLGKIFLAHRLAWLYVNGELPEFEIDHWDGNTSNNAIKNLREATHQQNQWNKRGKNGGYKGVTKHSDGKHYIARITVNDEQLYLGCFNSEEEAAKVYNDAAEKVQGQFNKGAL